MASVRLVSVMVLGKFFVCLSPETRRSRKKHNTIRQFVSGPVHGRIVEWLMISPSDRKIVGCPRSSYLVHQMVTGKPAQHAIKGPLTKLGQSEQLLPRYPRNPRAQTAFQKEVVNADLGINLLQNLRDTVEKLDVTTSVSDVNGTPERLPSTFTQRTVILRVFSDRALA